MAIDRRAARAAWKQRDEIWTIYAARTGGQVWVGVTRDVEAIRNRLSFTLRMKDCRTKGMQAAWDGSLEIEALEELDPTLSPMARRDTAQERRDHWCEKLGATAIEA